MRARHKSGLPRNRSSIRHFPRWSRRGRRRCWRRARHLDRILGGRSRCRIRVGSRRWRGELCGVRILSGATVAKTIAARVRGSLLPLLAGSQGHHESTANNDQGRWFHICVVAPYKPRNPRRFNPNLAFRAGVEQGLSNTGGTWSNSKRKMPFERLGSCWHNGEHWLAGQACRAPIPSTSFPTCGFGTGRVSSG